MPLARTLDGVASLVCFRIAGTRDTLAALERSLFSDVAVFLGVDLAPSDGVCQLTGGQTAFLLVSGKRIARAAGHFRVLDRDTTNRKETSGENQSLMMAKHSLFNPEQCSCRQCAWVSGGCMSHDQGTNVGWCGLLVGARLLDEAHAHRFEDGLTF